MASTKTSVPTGHALSAPDIEAPVRKFYVAFAARTEDGGFVYRWASVSAQSPGGALRICRVSHPDCAGFQIIGSPASLPASAQPGRRAQDRGAGASGGYAGERRRASDRALAA